MFEYIANVSYTTDESLRLKQEQAVLQIAFDVCQSRVLIFREKVLSGITIGKSIYFRFAETSISAAIREYS